MTEEKFNNIEQAKSRESNFDLNTEWLRQSRGFVNLNFHKELGLGEQEYLDSLPRFTPQPEDFKGKFDIPVLVERRIPLDRLCELLNINNYCHLDNKDVSPYSAWLNPSRYIDRDVKYVRDHLPWHQEERGATIYEGISLYLAKSELLRVGWSLVFLGGSSKISNSSIFAPNLNRRAGRLRLSRTITSRRHTFVTCGKQFIDEGQGGHTSINYKDPSGEYISSA